MLQKKILLKKRILIILLFLLTSESYSLDYSNEGLPGSYGQSDIEAAEQPDPTDRQKQLYPINPIDSATAKQETSKQQDLSNPDNSNAGRSVPGSSNPRALNSNGTVPAGAPVGTPANVIAPRVIQSNSPSTLRSTTSNPEQPENEIETSINQNPLVADETITETIRTKVVNNPYLSSSTVLVVLTQNGVVTLTGVVQTLAQKEAIEAIAQDTAGVKQVRSELTIEGISVTPEIVPGFEQAPLIPEYSPGLQQPPLVPPQPGR